MQSFSSRLDLFGKVRGLLRATFVAVVMLVVVLSGLLTTAKARLGETLLNFGEQLSQLTDAKSGSKQSILTINGLALHHGTASTPLTIKDALDRMQQLCSAHGGLEVPEALLKIKSRPSNRVGIDKLDGTFRHQTAQAWMLVCIDTERPLTLHELSARLQAFSKTGDLSSVGKLHYVLARREKSVTSLLAFWTEGTAQLLAMFPKAGDAPGQDIADVPRPERAVRIFSAREEGMPYAVTMYRSPTESPQALLEWYRGCLAQHGWQLVPSQGHESLFARRGSRAIAVHSVRAASGQVAVTIAELS